MRLTRRTLATAGRGIKNYFLRRPFCVSFEITYSCNARCEHCHLGGPVDEERAAPERFIERYRELKPVVAQVSGGEPLLRRDVDQIIRGLRNPNGPPHIVLTTNGALLTAKRYKELRAAGVDEFSLSFDFPDERHDTFRAIPGLFGKIQNLMEEIRDIPCKGIILSGVVNRKNFRDLVRMAEKAREWGVKMNFSTYTWLRTQKKEYMVPKEDLPELKAILEELMAHKRQFKTVVASDFVFTQMIKFFEHDGIPGCRAGRRFLVVNPDASLSPCGLIIKDYKERNDVVRKFLKNNTCTECYTSIRANTEKPAKYLIKDSLRSI